MAGRRDVVSGNHHIDHRNSGIWGIIVHFMFWSSFCVDYAEAGSPYTCAQASASYLPPLPVASLCYETSATAYRVVLDGFLTYNSSTSNCGCALSTTQNTTVNFAYVQSSLQPGYQNCGSILLIQAAANSFTINCYVAGTVEVSYLQPVAINFVKPYYGYNSDYCILLTSVNENADLTLNCNGDLNLPTTTHKPPSSSTRTTTTTTTTPKPTTTPLPTTTSQTTSNPTTTKQPTTTTTTIPTTAQYLSSAESLSAWSYVIPAIGGGLILLFAIVIAVCYNHRRISNDLYHNSNTQFAYDNKLNLPYSRNLAYDEGP